MRSIFMAAAAVLLASCGGQPDVPPTVTWGYGTGNGDPVAYPGPAPVYSRSYGLGADVPVSAGAAPTVQYGYGADGETGVMVQSTPPAPPAQHVTAPAHAVPSTPAS